jgi:hypothetical protein
VDTDNPLETDELAIPSANTTEPSMEGTFTLEIDERAELSVEDALTFNTLILPLSTTTLISSQSIPLTNSCLAYTLTLPCSIPGTGFGQFHILQHTNGNTISTYTLTEFEFQALQRTGVG